MKRVTSIILVIGLMVVTAAVTFAVTFLEISTGGSLGDISSKMREIAAVIDTYYIDDYDLQNLEDGAAAGMVAATGDKWAYYISADDYAAYEETMNNAYVGIGVTVLQNVELGGFNIESVTPGSPADLAGVLEGDVLLSVNGENALELGTTEVVNQVRGEAGTPVDLVFRRGEETLELSITRGTVDVPVAEYRLVDDVAIISIYNFEAKCAEETLVAIDQALVDEAKGIIFDLRNNPGGYKTELVAVLDRLLPEGDLFRSLDYNGKEEVDVSDEIFLDLPMVVLVNENSYSAAEFFAAAMQEYGAATIVGAQTTGKGNFQSDIGLGDGSVVHISMGKYFTPNGVSLTDTGVTPDVEVAYEMAEEGIEYPENDNQIMASLEVLADLS